MKDLLNNGFQPVSETELVMVEGGSPNPASDRHTVHGPGADDAGLYPDYTGQYPPPPKKGGGGNGNSYCDR